MRHFWEDFWGLCMPGEQRDLRFAMANPFFVISLRGQGCTHLEAIRIYLTVLLHERVHAIFDIHTCICDNGCKQKYARVSGRGHWVEWQAASKAIELADHKSWCLLRCELDLSLLRLSVIYHLDSTYRHLLNLRSWALIL
jgi:hypothetical protein